MKIENARCRRPSSCALNFSSVPISSSCLFTRITRSSIVIYNQFWRFSMLAYNKALLVLTAIFFTGASVLPLAAQDKADEEILVQLATEVHLLPILVGPIQNQNSDLPDTYLNSLRSVL